MLSHIVAASLVLAAAPAEPDVDKEIRELVIQENCDNADEISLLYRDAQKRPKSPLAADTHRQVAAFMSFCYAIMYERTRARAAGASSELVVSFLAGSSGGVVHAAPPTPIEIVRTINTLLPLVLRLRERGALAWSSLSRHEQEAVVVAADIFARLKIVIFAQLFGVDGRARAEQGKDEQLKQSIVDFDKGWQHVLPAPQTPTVK